MPIKIVRDKISKSDLREIAKHQFGDMVKTVVDTEKEIMAIGGELHADEEAIMIREGSKQRDLWGINLYPEVAGEDWIEFNSMINIRPSQGNQSREVENPTVQEKIRKIIQRLVTD